MEQNKETQTEKTQLEISEEVVKNKLYIIRGQRVMLDADLAEIYGYTTKAFNQQVKRNIEKFPEDFMFQLSKEETEEISCSRSQFVTLNDLATRGHNVKYIPYVFTEQGIYMLMTVLKGELAVRQSKALIRTFKRMKDFLTDNQNLLVNEELVRLALQTTQNTMDIAYLKENIVSKNELAKLMKNFNDPSVKKEYLIYRGKVVEAAIAYKEIYSQAKKTIYIVDNYIGLKTLLPLKEVGAEIKCTVFSDNPARGLHKAEYADFVEEYPQVDVSFRRTNNQVHDRYIVLDYKRKSEKIFHCGASSKDAGKKVTTITQIMDCVLYPPMIDALLENPLLLLE